MLALLAHSSCDSSTPCDGPGSCPAGKVCLESVCVVPTVSALDASLSHDVGFEPLDSGGSVEPLDAARVDRATAPALDAATPRDAAERADTGSTPLSGLGAACVVPNFSLGETDSCGVSDPNLYCLERLDGNGAYCTKACAIEEPLDGHHGGVDIGWHPHPDPCDEIGCCVPLEPGVDAGPFMPIDRVCRFRPDCN